MPNVKLYHFDTDGPHSVRHGMNTEGSLFNVSEDVSSRDFCRLDLLMDEASQLAIPVSRSGRVGGPPMIECEPLDAVQL